MLLRQQHAHLHDELSQSEDYKDQVHPEQVSQEFRGTAIIFLHYFSYLTGQCHTCDEQHEPVEVRQNTKHRPSQTQAHKLNVKLCNAV